MSEQQINALKGLILAVLAALVAGGVITGDVSDTVAAVAGAIITALAAFVVRKPSDVG